MSIYLSTAVSFAVRDPDSGNHLGTLGIHASEHSETLHLVWAPSGGDDTESQVLTPFEVARPFVPALQRGGVQT